MGEVVQKPMMGDTCPACGSTSTQAIESADSRCVKIRWFDFTCRSCGKELRVGPFRKLNGLDYEILLSAEELEEAIAFENGRRAAQGLDGQKPARSGCLGIVAAIATLVLLGLLLSTS